MKPIPEIIAEIRRQARGDFSKAVIPAECARALCDSHDKLRKALEFYANKRNYTQLRAHESPGAVTVERDNGAIAREALKP